MEPDTARTRTPLALQTRMYNPHTDFTHVHIHTPLKARTPQFEKCTPPLQSYTHLPTHSTGTAIHTRAPHTCPSRTIHVQELHTRSVPQTPQNHTHTLTI